MPDEDKDFAVETGQVRRNNFAKTKSPSVSF